MSLDDLELVAVMENSEVPAWKRYLISRLIHFRETSTNKYIFRAKRFFISLFGDVAYPLLKFEVLKTFQTDTHVLADKNRMDNAIDLLSTMAARKKDLKIMEFLFTVHTFTTGPIRFTRQGNTIQTNALNQRIALEVMFAGFGSVAVPFLVQRFESHHAGDSVSALQMMDTLGQKMPCPEFLIPLAKALLELTRPEFSHFKPLRVSYLDAMGEVCKTLSNTGSRALSPEFGALLFQSIEADPMQFLLVNPEHNFREILCIAAESNVAAARECLIRLESAFPQQVRKVCDDILPHLDMRWKKDARRERPMEEHPEALARFRPPEGERSLFQRFHPQLPTRRLRT